MGVVLEKCPFLLVAECFDAFECSLIFFSHFCDSDAMLLELIGGDGCTLLDEIDSGSCQPTIIDHHLQSKCVTLPHVVGLDVVLPVHFAFIGYTSQVVRQVVPIAVDSIGVIESDDCV